jgi:hypothetical protein
MSLEHHHETPQTAGRKARLRTLADLDKRTNAAKLTFELRDRIMSDLGGADRLSAMQMEVIDNVAVMGAMLRDAAAGYLTGEPTDLAEFTTLANAQRRLLADLGFQRVPRDVTPDLQNYIKGRS